MNYGASARVTTALTPTTTLVSLTAFRKLDFEFFVDADITELDLLTTHQHELQHQLSEEITISHQQPRLTWVGGVFLFDESITSLSGSISASAIPDSARPARGGEQPRGLRTGDRRIDVRLSAIAGVRYTHEGRTSTTPGTLQSRRAGSGGSRFGMAIPIPLRIAPGRPKSSSS